MRTIFLLILFGNAGIGNSLHAQDTLVVRNDTGGQGSIILIASTFNAATMSARKSKKELFEKLNDSLKSLIDLKLHFWSNVPTTIIPGTITDADSSIHSLMERHHASWIIVIESIDAYFENTGVVVEKDENGKSRTASYDICSAITYKFAGFPMAATQYPVKNCESFTKRSVVSGFLSGGPDIVGKSKNAYEIVGKNADQFLTETVLKLIH